MSCISAMVKNPLTVSPKETVGQGMERLLKERIRSMPVVDGRGNYIGMFHFRQVLKHLLPKVVLAEGGVDDLDFLYGTDQQVVDKLGEVYKMKIGDVVDTERPVLREDEVFWAMVHMIYKYDAPMAVLKTGTRKLIGIVSKQSLIEELQRRRKMNK